MAEAATGGFLQKKCVLKYFAKFKEKHFCWCLFFNKDFIKKETHTREFSYEL